MIYLCTAAVSLFENSSAELRSNEISKDKSAQTTGKIVSVSYCLWLHLLTKSVLNPTKLRGVIYDQSVDSSCFTL